MNRSLIFAFTIFLAVIASVTLADAQTTEFVYQGQLQNASVPANGNYDFEFLLFDSLSAGTQVGPTLTRNSVAVTAGIFTVKLDFGSQFPGADRFLEIHVRQTGGGAFTPLTPRQAVSSTPYSVKSLNAETATNANQLGGVAASGYLQTNGNGSGLTNLDAASIATGTLSNARLGQIPTANIADGAVTAPKIASGQAVKGVTVGATTLTDNITLAAGSNVTITPAGNTLTIASTGGGGVGGGGTTNNVPLFTAGMTLGNSLITQSGPNVGIGTTTPAAKLAVHGAGIYNAAGAARFDLFNTTAGSGFLQHVTDTGDWQIATTTGNTRMLINSTGNFGIGTATPDSESELTVDGRANPNQKGIYSISTSGYGVYGVALGTGGFGVVGASVSGTGVYGESQVTGTYGVFGESGNGYGVFGNSTSAPGVVGRSNLSYGVYGSSTNSYAGYFDGQIHVNSIPPTGQSTFQVCATFAGDIVQCNSSLRFKTNVRPFLGGLDIIRRLHPINFNWKEDGKPDVGLGAEDVAKVAPSFAFTDNKGEIEGVRYERLNILLINAVKEQQAQIETLQGQIKQLKEIVCLRKKKAGICK